MAQTEKIGNLKINGKPVPRAARANLKLRKKKRKKPKSFGPLTLAYMRARGYRIERTEQRVPVIFIARDLFGFIDYLGIRRGHLGSTTGIQVCRTSDLANREQKALALEAFNDWLTAGNKIEFHGWSLRGKQGNRKLWGVRVVRYWNWMKKADGIFEKIEWIDDQDGTEAKRLEGAGEI